MSVVRDASLMSDRWCRQSVGVLSPADVLFAHLLGPLRLLIAAQRALRVWAMEQWRYTGCAASLSRCECHSDGNEMGDRL